MFVSNYEKNTWVHRMDPRVKLVAILSLVLVPLIFTDFYYLLGITVLIIPIWFTAKIEMASIMGLVWAILIFSATAVVFATFYNYNHPEQIVLFSVGPLVATNIGFISGLVLGFRAAIPCFAVLILICTTDPAAMAKAMMKMKMPLTVAFMMLGALRMFPLVSDEMQNISTAQTIRGIDKKGMKNNFNAFKLAAFPLMINSLRKSRTMGLAIESKGFGSRAWNQYYQDFTIDNVDKAVLVFTIIFTVGAVIARYYFGLGVNPIVTAA